MNITTYILLLFGLIGCNQKYSVIVSSETFMPLYKEKKNKKNKKNFVIEQIYTENNSKIFERKFVLSNDTIYFLDNKIYKIWGIKNVKSNANCFHVNICGDFNLFCTNKKIYYKGQFFTPVIQEFFTPVIQEPLGYGISLQKKDGRFYAWWHSVDLRDNSFNLYKLRLNINYKKWKNILSIKNEKFKKKIKNKIEYYLSFYKRKSLSNLAFNCIYR